MYPAALSPYLCPGGGLYLLGYPSYDAAYDAGRFEDGARWGFNIGGGIQFGALGMLGVFLEGVYHRAIPSRSGSSLSISSWGPSACSRLGHPPGLRTITPSIEATDDGQWSAALK